MPAVSPRFKAPPKEGAPRSEWLSYTGYLHSRWTGVVVRVLGWGEGIAAQRAETAACLDRDRAAGRIR